MGTIRFEIRKEKIDKDGLIPIRMIYQVKGKRKYQNTGKKLYEDNWDEVNQRAIYKKGFDLLSQDIKDINLELTELRQNIEKIEKLFVLQGIPYSSDMVMDRLAIGEKPVTKRDTSSKELYSFIDKYILDNSSSRVKGSLSVYRALKSHLQGFQETNRTKVAFDKIDVAFFRSFQNYLFGLTKQEKDATGELRRVKALNNITIAKQLSTLKTFLNYAKQEGIEVSDKYDSFKIKKDNDLEVVALTQDEFKTLLKLNLSSRPAWDQVRDVFCFSCATGLRYSDLGQLKWDHIRSDSLEITAIKTGHKTMVPLNPDAKAILKKYQLQPRPLPIISNQKSNVHLSAICEFAGIISPVEIVRKYGNQRVATTYKKFELIRMHCGRKSFATINSERGMRAEIIMKIGGWKDWKSFKRYVNVTDESAKEAMKLAYSDAGNKSKLKAI